MAQTKLNENESEQEEGLFSILSHLTTTSSLYEGISFQLLQTTLKSALLLVFDVLFL